MVKHDLSEYWSDLNVFILKNHLNLIREVKKNWWNACFNFQLKKNLSSDMLRNYGGFKTSRRFFCNFWLWKGKTRLNSFSTQMIFKQINKKTNDDKQIYLEASKVETKSTLISIFFELSEGSTSMLSLYKEMKINIKLFFMKFICIKTHK